MVQEWGYEGWVRGWRRSQEGGAQSELVQHELAQLDQLGARNSLLLGGLLRRSLAGLAAVLRWASLGEGGGDALARGERFENLGKVLRPAGAGTSQQGDDLRRQFRRKLDKPALEEAGLLGRLGLPALVPRADQDRLRQARERSDVESANVRGSA